jgi:hypothetical protein
MSWHLGGDHHRMRPHGPVGLAHVMASARFPVYGLIGNPGGVTAQRVGYCSSPERILQVDLGFASSPAALRPGFRLELTTTDPNQLAAFGMPSDGLQLPKEGDVYDTGGRLYTRYASVEQATLDAAPARSCVIERFPLAQEHVKAVLRHWTRPNPEWLFTLTRPGLRLDGGAYEYTHTELFELLGHVGMVSDHPQVLAQYQREIAAWDRYFRPGSDSA